MHTLLLTCALMAGCGSQKCLCLRLLARACDPQTHTCCVPKYGCVPGQECQNCRPSCARGVCQSPYGYRLRFDYPWSNPHRPMLPSSPGYAYPAALRMPHEVVEEIDGIPADSLQLPPDEKR